MPMYLCIHKVITSMCINTFLVAVTKIGQKITRICNELRGTMLLQYVVSVMNIIRNFAVGYLTETIQQKNFVFSKTIWKSYHILLKKTINSDNIHRSILELMKSTYFFVNIEDTTLQFS